MISIGETGAATAARPGRLRRAAAGAWHVPAAVFFVVRHPRLWPFAVAPVVLTSACLVGGVVAAMFALRWVQTEVQASDPKLPDVLGLLVDIGLWAGIVTAGLVAGLTVALILTAPLLELIGRRAERLAGGTVVDRSKGTIWEILESMKGALRLLLAAPVAFAVGLIPIVGPPLGSLWAAHVLAFQQTDSPLARRGFSLRERRLWHREWRAETMGFGLAGLATLLVPFANLLLAPALAVGASLLVLEIEGSEMRPAPTTPDAPAPEPAAAGSVSG